MQPSVSDFSVARLLKYLLLLLATILIAGICQIEIIYFFIGGPIETIPYHVAAYFGLLFSASLNCLLTAVILSIPWFVFSLTTQRVSYEQYEQGITQLLTVLIANEAFKLGLLWVFLPNEIQSLVPDEHTTATLAHSLPTQIKHNADLAAISIGILLMTYYWLRTRTTGTKQAIIILAGGLTGGIIGLLNSSGN